MMALVIASSVALSIAAREQAWQLQLDEIWQLLRHSFMQTCPSEGAMLATAVPQSRLPCTIDSQTLRH